MGRVKADRAGGTRSRTTRERAEEDQQAAISTRKTNYKTVFEEVVEEKRKLKQFILLDDEPRPTNYEFIEAGSPLVTEKCKEFSRRRGLEVYQVKRNGHLGYFFNKQVVRESRVQLGFEYGRDRHSRRPIPAQRTRTFEEQVHLDNEAYKAISELYPRMPLDNRRAIVDLAFDLHKANVGSDNLVPIRQRVDLAVVAHIRHCFTDYDSLLKADKQSDARRKARQTIEETIMAQVVEWRAPDDNSNDDGQTEAVLREFIVIDDESEEAQDDAQEIETQNQNLQSGISFANSRSFNYQPRATASFGEVSQIAGDLRDSLIFQPSDTYHSRKRVDSLDKEPRFHSCSTASNTVTLSSYELDSSSAQTHRHEAPLRYIPQTQGGDLSLRLLETSSRTPSSREAFYCSSVQGGSESSYRREPPQSWPSRTQEPERRSFPSARIDGRSLPNLASVYNQGPVRRAHNEQRVDPHFRPHASVPAARPTNDHHAVDPYARERATPYVSIAQERVLFFQPNRNGNGGGYQRGGSVNRGSQSYMDTIAIDSNSLYSNDLRRRPTSLAEVFYAQEVPRRASGPNTAFEAGPRQRLGAQSSAHSAWLSDHSFENDCSVPRHISQIKNRIEELHSPTP